MPNGGWRFGNQGRNFHQASSATFKDIPSRYYDSIVLGDWNAKIGLVNTGLERNMGKHQKRRRKGISGALLGERYCYWMYLIQT